MEGHGEHLGCFRSLKTGSHFHLSRQNRKLELGLWHGTGLILVMSGQGNLPRVAREEGNITPVVCLGETDTDGLETLHSCFCTIPQVQHQCLHTSLALYPPPGPPELSRDKLSNYLAAEPDAMLLPGKVPCDLIGQDTLHEQAYLGTATSPCFLLPRPRQQGPPSPELKN